MCGIVGILGTAPVAENILAALKRLEYRGYDSAGIATVDYGRIFRVRAAGKLSNLEQKLAREPLLGNSGIGHTRWATHGVPNESNAHPHIVDDVVLVHNGIIENFRELKEGLAKDGAVFTSQTDSEIVAHLIASERRTDATPTDAVARVVKRLKGAFAFVALFGGESDMMIGVCMGAPLAIGHGDGQMFLGSDAIALAPFTNRVTYLGDGDRAVLKRRSTVIYDAKDDQVVRPIQFTQASAFLTDKGKYRHFMAKEIAEQPEVIGHTLAEYVDFTDKSVRLPSGLKVDFTKLDRLTLCACGTAYYAALTAKYWFERFARLPTEVDISSEFRYREAPLTTNGLSIVISQSGETADTLAALRYIKSQGQHTLAIVNVDGSTIAREAQTAVGTFAGSEIGVASTKAFTCQLTVLASLAIAIGRDRGVIERAQEIELISALTQVPRHISTILVNENHIARVSREMARARTVLYLGRGISYPIAMEGALKFKELSYIHAEGYAAGELKHGPIALVDENVPVVVLAPHDSLYDKIISNMEEVAARGGKIILVTDREENQTVLDTFQRIQVPRAHSFVSPLLYAIPMQLLAYHTAVFMGMDADQPRNLAKSVTVE